MKLFIVEVRELTVEEESKELTTKEVKVFKTYKESFKQLHNFYYKYGIERNQEELLYSKDIKSEFNTLVEVLYEVINYNEEDLCYQIEGYNNAYYITLTCTEI